MFVIIHGEADVVIHANGTDTTVATLHAGEAFGEMCLLTGEKRSATVIAKTDCDLWEIDRAHLQPLIHENASLAERLSELLARRRMATEGVLAAQTPAQVVEQKRQEYAAGFRKKSGRCSRFRPPSFAPLRQIPDMASAIVLGRAATAVP